MINPFWHYCDSFPELCQLEAPPKINTQEDIDYALCSADSGKYCRNGKTFVLQDVCGAIDTIDSVILDQTSIRQACNANFTAICQEDYYKSEVCPNGVLSYDFCSWYPEKCAYDSPTRDKCAVNWRHCLTKTDWDFCDSFHDLCFTAPPPPTFQSYADIQAALCSADTK